MATLPTVYMSKPGVCFPKERFTNDYIIEKVKGNYRGPQEGWHSIESLIRRILRMCNTQVRYLDLDPEARVAPYAVGAARACLQNNRVSPEDIDLLIFSGVARNYFEPATATEVAQLLGINQTHAFDVTSACVGHLTAIEIASLYLNMYEQLRTALVCTAEITAEFLNFDIQSTDELQLKSTGLTIGSAACAVLIAKQPWAQGCVKLLASDSYSLPEHWNLCQVPIRGTFISDSKEVMQLHKYIIPRLQYFMNQVNWTAEDVDYLVFHQPSETYTKKVISGIGVDVDRGIYTHHLYGNNVSATVGVVYDHLLKERELNPGDKILFGSAASGFTMVTLAGEWSE
jgi:3-oxoacyl-[acyl-carrier-protein] synthase III